MAPLRARAAFVLIAFVAITATGCGDDGATEGQPTPMNPGQCMTGKIYTCYDSRRNCSGRTMCLDGVKGEWACDDVPPNMNDGAVSMMDGSLEGDGSVVMNDAMVGDDSAVPDDAAQPGECAGSCLPEVPADFDGPFLTFIGGNDPPSCGGAYDDEGPTGGAGLTAPDADCSACTCDGNGVDSCEDYVTLEAGGNNTCGGGCPASFNESCGVADFACLDAETTTNVHAVVPASAGSCSPSEQDADVDAAEFAQLAHTCAPDSALTGGGCGGDQLCAPAGPFEGQYCVTQEGTHDCPAEGFSERHVFYGDIEDTRDCSACSCDRNCDYEVEIFAADNMTCMGTAMATLSIDSPNESEAESDCEDAPVAAGKMQAAFTVTGNGACAASGGEPEGEASGTDPITFCCVE